MNLGKAIYTLRKQKKVRQNVFAEAIGITQSYVSSIENNQKTPELKTIKKIADYFEIPVPVLVWNSLENSDIQENKKEAFDILKPFVDKFIESLITNIK